MIHLHLYLRMFIISISIFAIAGCDVAELGTDYEGEKIEKVDPDGGDTDPNTDDVRKQPEKPVPSGGGDTIPEQKGIKFSVAYLELREDESASLAVILDDSQDSDIKINWNIVSDESEGDLNEEFSTLDGQIIIPVGSKSAKIEIAPINNYITEGLETFSLVVASEDQKLKGSLKINLEDGPKYFKGLITAGEDHSCSVNGGALYCWGSNGSGELGNGNSNPNESKPFPIASMNLGVSFVHAKYDHTCAIKDRLLFCWGENDDGQIGNNTNDRSRIPLQVVWNSKNVQMVSTGFNHTCAIDDGKLSCWGNNDAGQLGNGNNQPKTLPEVVTLLNENVTDIATGRNFSCAIKNSGLYCWGDNSSGQLGMGNKDNLEDPKLVPGFETDVSFVDTGLTHTCAIKAGSLYCWGDNSSGQLGIGFKGGIREDPQPIVKEGTTAVSAGGQHTCALIDDKLNCWGRGTDGQLSTGENNESLVPTSAVAAKENIYLSLASGDFHSCSVSSRVQQCWGAGNRGELGDDLEMGSNIPVEPIFPN